MKNFKKYITLNVLAILGLIFMVLSLIVIFYFYPDVTAYDRSSGEDAPYGIFGLLSFCALFLFANTLTELALLPCILVEYLIYKYRKTEPKFIKVSDKYSRIHLIAFSLGLIFSIFSLFLGLSYILMPV